MRVGIFGGTFNPPHNGHKKLAQEFAGRLSLDLLMIIPDRLPPHKEASLLAGEEDRLNMCCLCFDGDIMEVSDIEMKREGKSYTYLTLEQIKKDRPDDELFFLMGSDMLLSFHSWREPQRILDCATVVAAAREEGETEKLRSYVETTFKERKDRFVIMDFSPFEVSSTEIRSGGVSAFDALSPKVRAYINQKNLYYATQWDDEKITALIKLRLKETRFIHSLNVAKAAAELAEIYGGDKEKCFTAGLLHDVMKNAPDSEHMEVFSVAGTPLSADEKQNKKLWHAMSGAEYVKHIMGITDDDIYRAVRYHTTGRAGMTLIEKIVFIADFISAERDYDDVNVMRGLAAVSLEKAMLYALRYTITDLVKKGQTIHKDSIALYNELILQENKRKD
ncbi:MAG: nicotinate (nicotinamide) nucleotide adenylyltransferase [Clostridia bacterium]|nr:nicotinate (nicotinamide) nucleotide adenylyltransferase [Clostridia bacterium]